MKCPKCEKILENEDEEDTIECPSCHNVFQIIYKGES